MIAEFKGDYRWLSNFVLCEINYNSFKFQSVEHAYQSAKSNSIEWKRFYVSKKTSSGDVKKASRIIDAIENWERPLTGT
jgi:hypothetical protein